MDRRVREARREADYARWLIERSRAEGLDQNLVAMHLGEIPECWLPLVSCGNCDLLEQADWIQYVDGVHHFTWRPKHGGFFWVETSYYYLEGRRVSGAKFGQSILFMERDELRLYYTVSVNGN